MARRYLTSELTGLEDRAGATVLPAEVGHHLARVIRVRAGDEIVLFDGQGHEAAATVTAVQGRRVEVALGRIQSVRREPRVAITVTFGVPRSQRADWLFEHGCEVGVARFVPLMTERTRPLGDRVERWRRIVAAASGQCDRSHLPVVEEPIRVADLAARRDLPEQRFLAAFEAPPLRAATTDAAILAVGPEGGFSETEAATLRNAGFAAASLGPLTLRTETAVLAGAVLLAGA